jgi:hypothetical protein
MNSTFEIQPQDAAMEAFRGAFLFPLPTHIVRNGKTMRFRLCSDRMAAEYLLRAQTVIRENGLPLHPDIVEWKVSGVIFDRFLEIQFDQTLLVPENY